MRRDNQHSNDQHSQARFPPRWHRFPRPPPGFPEGPNNSRLGAWRNGRPRAATVGGGAIINNNNNSNNSRRDFIGGNGQRFFSPNNHHQPRHPNNYRQFHQINNNNDQGFQHRGPRSQGTRWFRLPPQFDSHRPMDAGQPRQRQIRQDDRFPRYPQQQYQQNQQYQPNQRYNIDSITAGMQRMQIRSRPQHAQRPPTPRCWRDVPPPLAPPPPLLDQPPQQQQARRMAPPPAELILCGKPKLDESARPKIRPIDNVMFFAKMIGLSDYHSTRYDLNKDGLMVKADLSQRFISEDKLREYQEKFYKQFIERSTQSVSLLDRNPDIGNSHQVPSVFSQRRLIKNPILIKDKSGLSVARAKFNRELKRFLKAMNNSSTLRLPILKVSRGTLKDEAAYLNQITDRLRADLSAGSSGRTEREELLDPSIRVVPSFLFHKLTEYPRQTYVYNYDLNANVSPYSFDLKVDEHPPLLKPGWREALEERKRPKEDIRRKFISDVLIILHSALDEIKSDEPLRDDCSSFANLISERSSDQNENLIDLIPPEYFNKRDCPVVVEDSKAGVSSNNNDDDELVYIALQKPFVSLTGGERTVSEISYSEHVDTTVTFTQKLTPAEYKKDVNSMIQHGRKLFEFEGDEDEKEADRWVDVPAMYRSVPRFKFL